MAVPGFGPVELGDCIDNDKIDQAFASARALADYAGQGVPDLDCESFDASFSGDQRTGKVRENLFPGFDVNPTVNNGIECCIFLLNFVASFNTQGSANGQLDVVFRYTLECDGLAVATGIFPPGVNSGYLLQANCPPGSKIDICIDIEASQSGVGSATAGNTSQGGPITNEDGVEQANESGSDGPGNYNVTWSSRVCGGRACITERDTSATGIYIPCEVRPECCYGLATLALLVQVLNVLCRSFRYGGKTIRCVDVNTDGTASVPAALNLQSATDWIILGAVTVCVENMRPNDAVLVEPVLGCPSNPSECVVARIERKSNGPYNWDGSFCTEVPVLACGKCQPGEDLYVGEQPITDCDTQDSDPTVPDFGVTVEGNYSVWIFEDIVNDGADMRPIPPVAVCNNRRLLTNIEDKFDAINTAACQIVPINKTWRERKVIVPAGSPQLIQQALPWPPPTPPPRPVPDPPPVKKWRFYGQFKICSNQTEAQYSSFNDLEDTAVVAAHYEILCGGAVIHTSQPARCPWQIQGSGLFDPCSPLIQIAPPMIQCPIDQDLEIVGVVTTLLTGAAPVVTTYDVEFCVSVICF